MTYGVVTGFVVKEKWIETEVDMYVKFIVLQGDK